MTIFLANLAGVAALVMFILAHIHTRDIAARNWEMAEYKLTHDEWARKWCESARPTLEQRRKRKAIGGCVFLFLVGVALIFR